jgi:tetraacyldisaccharide 4'-kinase
MSLRESPALRPVLLAASYLYLAATELRNALYDRGVLKSYESSLPVVCVGNLTVGGNGKTPLVGWIVERALAKGRKPVILSRGYGGGNSGPHLVDAKLDRFQDVGDEPLMLARRAVCPVVIARDRVAGAKFIEQRGLGDLIVLDDGMQHRALARRINLVCVAAGNVSQVEDLLSGELLPAGLLRERLETGLKRASALIWQSRSPLPALPLPDHPRLAKIPCFRTSALAELTPIVSECVVVTGVANPSAVAASLGGVRILEHVALRDHSAALPEALSEVRRRFPGTAVVVTEKDAIKLDSDLEGVSILRQRLQVEDAEGLWAMVSGAIG